MGMLVTKFSNGKYRNEGKYFAGLFRESIMRDNSRFSRQRTYNCLIKIPLWVDSTKRHKKSPSSDGLSLIRLFPIDQPLAPYKSRLPCGHRGCPSRTLYGKAIVTKSANKVKLKVLVLLHFQYRQNPDADFSLSLPAIAKFHQNEPIGIL